MKKRLGLIAAALVMLVGGVVFGAQVSSSTWWRMYSHSGRSDGIYVEKTSHALHAFGNGEMNQALGKAWYEDFTLYGDGDDFIIQADGTVADLTDETINYLYLPSGNKLLFASIDATSTAGLDMDAGSLDISGDDTNGEGFEIYAGLQEAVGAPFVVGTDPAFYTCARWAVTDYDGVGELHVGFRQADIIDDAFDDHTEFSTIGNLAGSIKIETDLAGAGTTTTDTTEDQADGVANTFCVYISASGVASYKIDGHSPATNPTATFTHTDGAQLIPFIWYMNAAGTSGEVDLYSWVVGYQ